MESLFLAHSFNVSQELCFACGSTASHGHLHPLGRDQASGPEARARILFTLGALEEVLGFANVIVRNGVDHGARPLLVGRIVEDRPAPDTAFILLDVEKPRNVGFRPAAARSCREQRTVHGVVLTCLEKS